MEIIRLNEAPNEQPDRALSLRQSTAFDHVTDAEISDDATLTVTKITAAVKTPGRYNIFINQKYSFSLDELQLVDARLKIGQELTTERLAELKDFSAFGKNYIRALDLISRRLRSTREIRDYARRKQWTPENTDKVIARLTERGYLDDAKFARAFVTAKAHLKNWSKRRMQQELRAKGIETETIEQVLADSDDFDEAAALQKLIQKKRGHYADQRKLIAYLAGQGFSYDAIQRELGRSNS